MTRRLAGVVTGRRSRWAVLGAWLVLLVVFAPLSSKLNSEKVDTSTSLLPADSQSGHVAHLLATRFAGGDRSATVLIYRRPGGLTQADRTLIAADARAASQIPMVAGPLPAFLPGPGGVLKPAPQQVSSDGTTAFTLVGLAPGKAAKVADAVKDLRALDKGFAPGLTYHVTGSAVFFTDINNAVESSDVLLVGVTVLLVLALLLWIYRSPLLALIPLFIVIVSYVVASGVIDILARHGLRVDSTATSLLLVLMFGAGTDYCLLLTARYKEDLRRIEDGGAALRHAIPRAVPAILASGLTVAAALLTLLTSELNTNHTLGPVAAIGVLVVLLGGVTLLPALLSLLGRRAFWPARGQAAYAGPDGPPAAMKPGRWERLAAAVTGHPWRALVGGVVILAVCAVGLFSYTANPTPIKEFRKDPDSKRGYELFASEFSPGAASPSTLLIQRPGGTVSAAEVAAVRARMAQTPGVAEALPAPEPRSLDGRIARLEVILSRNPFAPAAVHEVPALRRAAAAAAPGLKVLIGDGAARYYDQGAAEARDLRVIAPLALLVILLVLVVLLRAIVAPLFLIATVVLSYAATMGLSVFFFQHVLGRPGEDGIVLIVVFIFLVALGVDYNIFLMSRIREEAAVRGTRAGIVRGLVTTGPVITSAGLILAGTFAVLMTLPTWTLFELGFSVALGVLIDTFLVRSVVVPAITTLLGDRSWWPSSPQAGTRGISGVREIPDTLRQAIAESDRAAHQPTVVHKRPPLRSRD
jgi:RND superfamily putative drug exporter